MTQRRPTHKIEILGDKFIIRELLPIDFLGNDRHISMFFVKNKKTMYEQVKAIKEKAGRTEAPDTNEELNALKLVLKAGVLMMNYKPFDTDMYLKESVKFSQAMTLQHEIIKRSFSFAYKIELDNEVVQTLDIQAKRYGKTPAEILWPTGGYTAMDAYTLNLLVASHGIRIDKPQPVQLFGGL